MNVSSMFSQFRLHFLFFRRVIKQRLNYQGNVSYEAHDTSRSKTSYQV